MINIEDLPISQPALCAIASIDKFCGYWQGRDNINAALAKRLWQRAINESIADTQEKHNYRQLLEQIVNHYEEIIFFETSVKKLHKLLMADSLIDEKEKGEYKQRLNPIYSKTIDGRPIDIFLETASPFETPQLMHRLLEWTRNCLESKKCHPLPVIALFMVHFLVIHPFQDGNSRLVRALVLLLLLKAGYTHLRLSSFEAAIEDNKDEYYRCLRQVQDSLTTAMPQYDEWLLFFLHTIQRQQKQIKERTESVGISYGKLPELSAQILELAEEKGRVTLKSATEGSGANINTVKKHLASLVRGGYLVRHGSARGTWYIKAQ